MNQRTGNEAHPARILFTEAKSFSTCVAISRCAYNTAAAAPVDRSAALHSPVLYISNSTSISEKGLRVVPRHRPKTAMKNIYKAIVSSQLPVLNVTCRSSRTTKHRSIHGSAWRGILEKFLGRKGFEGEAEMRRRVGV